MGRHALLLLSAAVVWGAASSVMAQAPALSDEQYRAVQTAFLQENFEQVVRTAQPLLAGSAQGLLTDASPTTALARLTRVWLWCALSLERLQRTNEALLEIDRLKAALTALADDPTTPISQESVWPEVLFWEGEISRKGFQLVRARLAYQQLLMRFPASSWRTRAQLGLGLVLFDQQAYDAAREQMRAVGQAGPTAPWAREAMLVEALCDLKLKRLSEAIALFDQLLQQPLDAELRTQVVFYRGEALTGLGRYAEASESYHYVIRHGADSMWVQLAQFGLGWSEFRRQHCRESLDAFDAFAAQAAPAVFSRDTQDVRPELWYAQGRCLMELNHEDQAQVVFERLRRQFPSHPLAVEATLATAELLERRRRFDDARALVQPLLEGASVTADQRQQSRLRWGSLLLASGHAAQAAVQFDLAKDAADPATRQMALNGLADAELWLGRPERAQSLYLQAIDMNDANAAGWYAAYQLGRLAAHAGDVAGAIARFGSVMTRANTSVAQDAQVALALAYVSNGQPQEARATLEALRRTASDTLHAARAGYYLAVLAVQDGQLEEGRALCEDVMRRAPGSEEALDARLLLMDLAGDRTSSARAIDELRSMLASLSDAQARQRGKLARKLAELLRQSRRHAEAIHWYELAWEELPSQRGEVDYRIASCYEELGDMALAIHRYQVPTQPPWQIRGQLAAARLMEREEQWEAARAVYQRLVAQAAPEAKIAQERLGGFAGSERADQE